jgi:hypothetical protein
MVIDAPGGVKLHPQAALVRKAVGIPEVSQYILQLAMDIDEGYSLRGFTTNLSQAVLNGSSLTGSR